MKYIKLLIIILISSGCNNSGGLSDMERKKITADVEQVMADYFREIKDSGLMAELKYLDSSKDFFWAPPGYASALTYDSVRTIIRLNALRPVRNENVWESLKINPLTPELASYTGLIKANSIDATGKINTVRLIETGTVIKRKEGWRLLCGQTTVLQGK